MNTTRRQLLKAVPFVAAGLFVPRLAKAQTETIPLDQGILDALTDAVRQAIQKGTPDASDFARVSEAYRIASGHLERTGYHRQFEQIAQTLDSGFTGTLAPEHFAWVRRAWYDHNVPIPVDPIVLTGFNPQPALEFIQQNGLLALSQKITGMMVRPLDDSVCGYDGGPNCPPNQQTNPTQAGLMQLGAGLALLSAVWAAGGALASAGPAAAGATIVCPLCTAVAASFAVVAAGIFYFAQYGGANDQSGGFGGFTQPIPGCYQGGGPCNTMP